ncbi:MAG: hypothetical protein AMJ89_04415 [candidate division Zixibacteria bacterium SM23_73]|nr:MAG: hypothetical protein AMJ89_04415 [candidate division Zixibacteria bacterium SM23_73]
MEGCLKKYFDLLFGMDTLVFRTHFNEQANRLAGYSYPDGSFVQPGTAGLPLFFRSDLIWGRTQILQGHSYGPFPRRPAGISLSSPLRSLFGKGENQTEEPDPDGLT